MPKRQFDENVENHLCKIVVDEEYQIAKKNQDSDIGDYEIYLDLFDSERPEKEYAWMSDISLPEFFSHMVTQTSIDVGQYFQTRDFVEVYLQDESDEAFAASESNQELINRTLNRRDLYHYQKFVRSKTINHLIGHVDMKCWWDKTIDYDYDVYTGEEIRSIRKDCFNYQILDPRNVFTSSEYVYSVQQKEFVLIRDEATLWKLYDEADSKGYFNLDYVRDNVNKDETHKTDTHRETVEDVEDKQHSRNMMGVRFDRFERYGKYWITEDGEPGIDENGEIIEGSRLEEVIMTFVTAGTSKFLIGFHTAEDAGFVDATGNTYRPLIRGLCYIHPSRDSGAGDGKYSREIQRGIDDTFNVSNDRTLLATLPTFKGRKYVTDDTDSVYIEPMHLIELENPETDLMELQVQDNIVGAMTQLQLLKNMMDQVWGIYPTTMGDMPRKSTTTATAVAGAEARTNQRSNYKSMTFEYTALIELYWMITQMTYAFAEEETAYKLMGEKMWNFNPTLDYFYKPLSQSIETEHAKAQKLQQWITILGYIINLGHPDAPMLFNFIIIKIAELMGDEYVNVLDFLLRPDQPLQQGRDTEGQASGQGASNQHGIPQSAIEIAARGGV